MSDKIECRICVIVDENGDYIAHHDEDTAHDQANDDLSSGARRKVWITALISAPEADEVEIDVADTAGETITATAE